MRYVCRADRKGVTVNRYELVGACIVDNETGRVRVEAVDTPRNRRKLSKLVDTFNRQEREREALARTMCANRCAWI